MAYGQTRAEAIAKVEVLALPYLADRLEHNEDVPAELLKLFRAA
jgi:predicted RNase H-like HicB family nuclease